MIQYIDYQCSICRKRTERQNNPVNLEINNCDLTPGCLGKLIKTGSSISAFPKIAVAGDSAFSNADYNGEPESFIPVSDENGILYIAVRESYLSAHSFPNLTLSFSQLVNRPINYVKYTFNITSSGQTVIYGKDSASKNLRFDSSAISDGRVIIKINGIDATENEYSLTPNIITFDQALPVSSRVDIYIYEQSLISNIDVTFSYTQISVSSGAWDNIRRVNYYDSSASGSIAKNYYSVYFIRQPFLDVVKLKLNTAFYIKNNTVNTIPLDKCFLLLSKYPFSNFERVNDFIISASSLSDDYLISNLENNSRILAVNSSLIKEIYPPLEIEAADYLSANSNKTSSAANFQFPKSKFILT